MADWLPALGCFVFPAAVAAVWALIAATRARREASAARAVSEGLASRLSDLERRLESAPSSAATAASPETTEREPAAEVLPLLPGGEPRRWEGAVAEIRRAAPPSPPAKPPPVPFDWEKVVGVKLFAWLGGGALFLAAVLFLQYSIQHDLISPSARVAIGLLVGTAAFWGGDWVRKRANRSGQAISGAGIAILYASIFAAHTVYQLISGGAAMAAMAAVTAAAAIVAVRRNTFMLAVLALLGGFATPVLLSTGEDRPLSLFAYTALLDLGIVLVARRRRWAVLSVLGIVGSTLLYSGWAARFLDRGRVEPAMVAAGLLAVIFFFAGSGDGEETDRLFRIPAVLAAGLLFLLAVSVAGTPALRVSPGFLVSYLLAVAAGAWRMSLLRPEEPLVPGAAAAAIAVLILRVGPDLFPTRGASALAKFAAVPAAFAAAWFLSRRGRLAHPAITASRIALGGTFLLLERISDVQPLSASIGPEAFFAAVIVALGLAIGIAENDGVWAAAAECYAFLSLAAFLGRCSAERLPEFLPVIIGPGLLFWSLPFLVPRLRTGRAAWIASAASPVLFYSVLYAETRDTWGSARLGVLALAIAFLALLSLKRSVALSSGDPAAGRRQAALFGAVALLFATAAIPILLDRQWITIAWALEAAALVWLFGRVPHDGLIAGSAVLASAVFVRLLLNPALWTYQPRSGTPVWNWYLYVFAVPAAAFLMAARWSRASARLRAWHYPAMLASAAGVLLFVLVNVEIADFYSTGPTLVFRLSGGGLAEDMTYSLAWAIFAVLLLVIGIRTHAKLARAAALGVLLLTMGKVSLHDLWTLGSLYRVGSIVALALSLLAVSFLTQRFVLAREPDA